MVEEELGQGGFHLERSEKDRFVQFHDRTLGQRNCGRHPLHLSVEAPFADELSGAQNRDDGYLPLRRYNRKLDPTLPHVEDRAGTITLREDDFGPIDDS